MISKFSFLFSANRLCVLSSQFSRTMPSVWTSLIVLIFSVTGGCFQDSQEASISTIHGTVTYQGKPVTGGTLTFEVTTEHGTVPHGSEIELDGRYKVSYAVPGPATIIVQTGTLEGLPEYMPLPRRYEDAKQSGLKYDIKEGIQQHDIILK